MFTHRFYLLIYFTTIFASQSHSATHYGHLLIVAEPGAYGFASLTLEQGELLEPTATAGTLNLGVMTADGNFLSIAEAVDSRGNFVENVPVLSGPCDVYINGVNGSLMMYKITKPDTAMISNVVTLPHTSGNWEVQLETSSDLKNWTAVVPGSFSGDPDLQFFRVKATQMQSP